MALSWWFSWSLCILYKAHVSSQHRHWNKLYIRIWISQNFSNTFETGWVMLENFWGNVPYFGWSIDYYIEWEYFLRFFKKMVHHSAFEHNIISWGLYVQELPQDDAFSLWKLQITYQTYLKFHRTISVNNPPLLVSITTPVPVPMVNVCP